MEYYAHTHFNEDPNWTGRQGVGVGGSTVRQRGKAARYTEQYNVDTMSSRDKKLLQLLRHDLHDRSRHFATNPDFWDKYKQTGKKANWDDRWD